MVHGHVYLDLLVLRYVRTTTESDLLAAARLRHALFKELAEGLSPLSQIKFSKILAQRLVRIVSSSGLQRSARLTASTLHLRPHPNFPFIHCIWRQVVRIIPHAFLKDLPFLNTEASLIGNALLIELFQILLLGQRDSLQLLLEWKELQRQLADLRIMRNVVWHQMWLE